MTEYLTVDALEEVLKEVGLSTKHVAAIRFNGDEVSVPGLYFDLAPGYQGEKRIVLVVTTYALNEEGKRHFSYTGKVAMETRRFFIETFGTLTPCPTVREEETVSAQ